MQKFKIAPVQQNRARPPMRENISQIRQVAGAYGRRKGVKMDSRTVSEYYTEMVAELIKEEEGPIGRR